GVPDAGSDRPRRAAILAAVVGNHVDQINIFLPLVALAPAMATLAGPASAASGTALVVMAMLLGRPIGSLLFGRIADRVGRTRTTRVALAGTAACTLLIAGLPSHEVLGAGTFVLLVALRFVGGIFLAGEYTAAVPLAMEWSSARRRGLFSGLVMSMAPAAQALIAFVTALLLAVLGPAEYAAWGWRASFVVGGCASLAMLLYYSRHVVDAPAEHVVAPERRGSVREVTAGAHGSAFWRVFTLMTGLWLMTNMVVITLTGRMGTDAGLPGGTVPVVMGVASVGQALVMALTGHLSTLVGRRAYFLWAAAVAAVTTPALWLWTFGGPHGVVTLAVCAVLLQVLTVSAYGPVGAYLSESFPSHVRSTGYGAAYSTSIVLPALHPYWLPPLASVVGRQPAVALVLLAAAALVALGAA
ncbi:MFS transporter, partial [Kribbia dieselivorans]|uniref:MFS transporter n=1 Tax=Kribbia dieselivorans TaxID=331526 RepID=UPI000AAB8910